MPRCTNQAQAHPPTRSSWRPACVDVALPALWDLSESSCGSRCHLSEDGMARPVADGAGSILPHDGALVHEASQGWLHERVPARNAALSKQFHHVVSDIQRKAAVCFDGPC